MTKCCQWRIATLIHLMPPTVTCRKCMITLMTNQMEVHLAISVCHHRLYWIRPCRHQALRRQHLLRQRRVLLSVSAAGAVVEGGPTHVLTRSTSAMTMRLTMCHRHLHHRRRSHRHHNRLSRSCHLHHRLHQHLLHHHHHRRLCHQRHPPNRRMASSPVRPSVSKWLSSRRRLLASTAQMRPVRALRSSPTPPMSKMGTAATPRRGQRQ